MVDIHLTLHPLTSLRVFDPFDRLRVFDRRSDNVFVRSTRQLPLPSVCGIVVILGTRAVRVFGLIGIGLLVLFTIGAVLDWALFRHRFTTLKYLPDTKNRFVARAIDRIYKARLRMPSADADENGLPDWYERTDCFKEYPNVEVRLRNQYVYRGERTHLRLKLEFLSEREVRWPRNTEVLITADAPVLLATDSADGTPPTTGPLRVRLTPQGNLDFDVLASSAQYNYPIQVTHARSGHVIRPMDPSMALFYVPGWRGPAKPCHIEDRVVYTIYQGPTPPAPAPYLVWEPAPEAVAGYVVEIARADFPDEWVDVYRSMYPDEPTQLYSPQEFKGVLVDRAFQGYRGPVIYRAVPVNSQRPVER